MAPSHIAHYMPNHISAPVTISGYYYTGQDITPTPLRSHSHKAADFSANCDNVHTLHGHSNQPDSNGGEVRCLREKSADSSDDRTRDPFVCEPTALTSGHTDATTNAYKTRKKKKKGNYWSRKHNKTRAFGFEHEKNSRKALFCRMAKLDKHENAKRKL